MSVPGTPRLAAGRLLPDGVEDTPVTFAELEVEGFSSSVLAALRLLTHEKPCRMRLTSSR